MKINVMATLTAAILQMSFAGGASASHIRNHHHFVRSSHSFHDVSGRPSAWCGWEMRRLVGSDPGPHYNLARNWTHWGRAANGPAPGAIGVMPHHIFKVIRVLDRGKVLAISGNDGHAVRIRPRSTAGVIAWRI